MPVYVAEGEPYRPDFIAWIARGKILRASAIHPDEPDEAVVTSLLEAMRRPATGSPRQPKRVRVASPAIAALLRERVDPGIEIVVAPTPELDAVVGDLLRHFQDHAEETGPSYLGGERVSEGAVAAFFAAAARLHRTAPWDAVALAEHVLGLDVPAYGVTNLCLSIIGQLGQSVGVLIFESIDAFRAARAKAEGGPRTLASAKVFSITFEAPSDLPPAMYAELAAHGWKIAGERAAPLVLALDGDGVAVPLDADDVEFATMVAAALATFIEQHRPALSTWPPAPPIAATIAARASLGEVVLRAPHPGWSLRDAPSSHGEPGGVPRTAAFLKLERAARGAAGVELAERVLGSLHELMAARGEVEADLAPILLDEYMTRFFPYEVPIFGDAVSEVPAVLARYVRWLRDEGAIDAGVASALLDTVDRQRPSLVRRAGDMTSYSLAKKLVLRMLHEGIDVSDRQAVEAFLAATQPRRPRRR